MAKARFTTFQLRRIIYEELVDHYLTQRLLWVDKPQKPTDQPQQLTPVVNKNSPSA